MPSPAFPGMFFTAAAAILLLFASISPPAWQQIPFLKASAGGQETVFGVLGYCVKGGSCSTRSVGYDIAVAGVNNVNINPTGLKNLTYILILHPIGGFIALLAFVFGLLGVCAASRFSTIMMAVMAFFAAVITLVVFVIDMVLWNLLRKRLQDGGYDASLGLANWLTVAAFGSLVLGFCTSICGACGRFATGRSAGEKY